MQKREKGGNSGKVSALARVSARRLSAQWTDFGKTLKGVVNSFPSLTILLKSSNSVAFAISEPKTNSSKLVRARSGRDFLFSSLRT